MSRSNQSQVVSNYFWQLYSETKLVAHRSRPAHHSLGPVRAVKCGVDLRRRKIEKRSAPEHFPRRETDRQRAGGWSNPLCQHGPFAFALISARLIGFSL